MQNHDSLQDRILIRELYGRYALASAQRDVNAWISCWTEDACWKTQHFEKTGRAELQAQWDMIWSGFASAAVFNEVGQIQISDFRAKAHSCVLEIIRLANGGILRMAGLYDDEFARKNGEWRFARRTYQLLSEEMTGQ